MRILAVVGLWGFVGLGAVLGAPQPCRAEGLTPIELRWLQGSWPVLQFAQASGLPVDVVVQPQPARDLPPMAMAFIGGRCKFVLSMRSNPEVQATMARTSPDLLDAALELMAAHELGHCRRHVSGAWQSLPAALTAVPVQDAQATAQGRPVLAGKQPDSGPDGPQDAQPDTQAERREEAYGDLVGLAWIVRQRPALYARMHAWLLNERAGTAGSRGPHDTTAWVRLVPEAHQLQAGPLFAAADRWWAKGLHAEREGDTPHPP